MTIDKHEVLLRMRAIELLAYWEGRLVTNRLMNWFGLSRQQASADIKRYNTLYNPYSLIHDPSVKGYVPKAFFQPVLTTAHINEYLNMISGLVSESHVLITTPEPNISAIQLPDRSVRPEVVREILRACRTQSALKIIYASMQHPQWHERTISPHTIVYSGFRWYVRAYCHKSKIFKDFLLSRIGRTPITTQVNQINSIHDLEWKEEIELTLIPNPNLSEPQKLLVEKDFGIPDGRLQIFVKKALANYTLQRYQVATTLEEAKEFFKYPLILQVSDIEKLPSYHFDQTR
ncbi:helix-turn-helix transcriptional regulator [Acinetobacter pollinis]|uniref:WYL domain-containing protein n=1 Tax=Acinetobacter pollinis TaxID=2605270 RepID=A0ABU6DUM5_9GAMM|nr:WYL domain-containing protein [Acinetobacter pollinis]MEB5477556.1 WYL domain-containing protein [Acinetobacter pollinis]